MGRTNIDFDDEPVEAAMTRTEMLAMCGSIPDFEIPADPDQL
jgi:hypothetical protein